MISIAVSLSIASLDLPFQLIKVLSILYLFKSKDFLFENNFFLKIFFYALLCKKSY